MTSRTPNKTEAILEAFANVARPIFLKHYLTHSCIAGVRITIEALSRFGLLAKPVPVSLVVEVPALKLAYVSGSSVIDQASRATMHKLPTFTEGWDGHLVALVENRWLVDLSFGDSLQGLSEQHEKLKGYEDDLVLQIVLPDLQEPGFSITAEFELTTRQKGTIKYISLDDTSYLATPAWEIDEDMRASIDDISDEMGRRLGLPRGVFL